MKRFDLDAELKSVQVPERGEDYWADFPRRVTAELQSSTPQPVSRRAWMNVMMWNGSAAIASLALVLTLGFSSAPQVISCAMVHNKQEIRTTIVQLSERVETLMQNEHGMQWLLADQQ